MTVLLHCISKCCQADEEMSVLAILWGVKQSLCSLTPLRTSTCQAQECLQQRLVYLASYGTA